MAEKRERDGIGEDWMACVAALWCTVQLDEDNSAMMACITMKRAHDVDAIMGNIFEIVFDQEGNRSPSVHEIKQRLALLQSGPARDGRAVLGMIESLFKVAGVRWDLRSWARARDCDPPRQPESWTDKEDDAETVLEVIPPEFTARLLWAIHRMYSRAVEGNWSRFARCPEEWKMDELPDDMRSRLDDIMSPDEDDEKEL
jgi:hypothetical protein